MDSKTVACPICLARLPLPLPSSRGVQIASRTHACRERDGTKATSVFRLSRHPDGGTTTLSVTVEYHA